MNKEIPFENQNPLMVRMRGVHAHTIAPNDIKSRARFLVEEAIKWGGGSGNKKADHIKMEKDLQIAAARHNTEHGHLGKALGNLLVAKADADKVVTNPMLIPELVDAKLAALDETAWQAFMGVLETNTALKPYRLYERHGIPEGINLDIKDRSLPKDSGQQ
ncbi:MAG: hypothetical protein NT149_03400 [Candidatus Gottesmanbacteria bacterium]|nr:hypothetical protein [Candidatus Gottesmanbacteria bacterium]